MGIFTSMFSTKSTDNMVDALINTGDKLVYTDEEKAEMKLKIGNAHIRMLKAMEPFKLAQRLLALTITIPYMLAWLVTFGMSFTTSDLDMQYKLLQGDVGMIFMMVLSFYFASGMAEGVISKYKGK